MNVPRQNQVAHTGKQVLQSLTAILFARFHSSRYLSLILRQGSLQFIETRIDSCRLALNKPALTIHSFGRSCPFRQRVIVRRNGPAVTECSQVFGRIKARGIDRAQNSRSLWPGMLAPCAWALSSTLRHIAFCMDDFRSMKIGRAAV